MTFTLDHRTVTLIDTPGFDDSDRSDADILALVANHMAQTYEQGKLLTGVIFVQPINQARLQGSEARRNRLFKKILGEDAYKRVVIATTMWNQVSEEEATSRVDQRRSRNDVWGDMVKLGAQVERHDDNAASAAAIIRKLMKFESPLELQLQKELLQTGGKVALTSAGKQLDEDLGAMISKLRSEIEELKSEREDTSRELAELKYKIQRYEQEKKAMQEADVSVLSVRCPFPRSFSSTGPGVSSWARHWLKQTRQISLCVLLLQPFHR